MRGLIAALIAILPAVAFAHHPFEVEYDPDAPIELSAEVKDVLWADPHVIVVAMAKDKAGKAQEWKIEAASPATMKEEGWSREMLKKGDLIKVHGYQGKAKAQTAVARTIELPNGKTLSAASKDGGPPQ